MSCIACGRYGNEPPLAADIASLHLGEWPSFRGSLALSLSSIKGGRRSLSHQAAS